MASKSKILFIGGTRKFIVEASAKADHLPTFWSEKLPFPTRQSPKSSRTSRIWATSLSWVMVRSRELGEGDQAIYLTLGAKIFALPYNYFSVNCPYFKFFIFHNLLCTKSLVNS
ncbi:uncharacterized protein LOC103964487 [Pyrus x bretschneideri]|uniref:uncharacterized protein LOC103964487 n=1 Tax=Pyrus x bretschneideri TaxID=225117 RepID=UPI0005115C81|nr:uncharacterized protein LOC103964487 [Pyrus x bretschneideri]